MLINAATEEDALPDVPRRGKHGRHHGRHDRHPVRDWRGRPPQCDPAGRAPRRRLRPGAHRRRQHDPTRLPPVSATDRVRQRPKVGGRCRRGRHVGPHLHDRERPDPARTSRGATALPAPGAGPAADVSCASCHNPHGNGQYRILNVLRENADDPGDVDRQHSRVVRRRCRPQSDRFRRRSRHARLTTSTPSSSHGLQVGRQRHHRRQRPTPTSTARASSRPSARGAAGQGNSATNNFTISATLGGAAIDITTNGTGGTVTRTSGVPVTDATLPAAGDARNYTVMQVKSPTCSGTVDGRRVRLPALREPGRRCRGRRLLQRHRGHVHAPPAATTSPRNVPWNPTINNAACDPTVFPAATRRLRDGEQRPQRAPDDVQRPDHAVVRFVPHPVLRQQQPDGTPPRPTGRPARRGSTRGRTTPCSTTSTAPSRAGTA